MSSTGAAVRLESVSHQFLKTGKVLEQIDLRINPGEFVALLGPSGCGKSTLLRLVSYLDRPTTGLIAIDHSTKSFVFQEATLLPWRTALSNVELPLELANVSSVDRVTLAQGSLRAMGLGDAFEKYPQELSGGMKMRVAVARALVTKPSLLLLDEPFAALDENSRFALQKDLRKRWQAEKPTVLFVTHSITEAVFLADRIIVLSGRPGKIIADHQVNLPIERSEHLRLEVSFLQEVQKVHSLVRGAFNV